MDKHRTSDSTFIPVTFIRSVVFAFEMDPAERINGISPRLPNPINNSPIIRSRVADPQRMKVDLNPILFDDDGNHDREWKRVRKRRTASSLETQLDHRFDPPGFRDAFNFRKTSLLSLNHRSHDSCTERKANHRDSTNLDWLSVDEHGDGTGIPGERCSERRYQVLYRHN